jgi:hypothetical protein
MAHLSQSTDLLFGTDVNWRRPFGLMVISMPNAWALLLRAAISSSSVICASRSCSEVGWAQLRALVWGKA